MIPQAAITAWRNYAPWQTEEQTEQDLILSRVLVEIFSNNYLRDKLAFRGGTALHKLYLSISQRYSEDIDLVQITPEPIGEILDAIRSLIDPLLGEPKRKQNHGRVVLIYRFISESTERKPLRLKIEINTREHYCFWGYIDKKFSIDNTWFSGEANLKCFELEELLATKLRALYQRKKGRDLYDLFVAYNENKELNLDKLVECFIQYISKENNSISRAQFEENLIKKSKEKSFINDITPLLQQENVDGFTFEQAFNFVLNDIVKIIPGEPWKGKD